MFNWQKLVAGGFICALVLFAIFVSTQKPLKRGPTKDGGLSQKVVGDKVDNLVIISPHRKSIQDEYIPLFKQFYRDTYQREVNVDWLDQGGASDDIRFIRAKFAQRPESADVDIFWGGGSMLFIDMANEGLLRPVKLRSELTAALPENVGGIPMRDSRNRWFAQAISGFGIFYNKKLTVIEKLKEPAVWSDLTNPKYFEQVSLTDPRRSSVAGMLNAIMMQSLGWEKGWQTIIEIAGNTRQFTQMSSDPIKAVTSGDAAAAPSIDFYALAKMSELGPENVGFVLPPDQTILDPDPVGLLRGAPNAEVGERFINFLLDLPAQKLLMLPKGVPDGPIYSFLGRLAANPQTYPVTDGRRVYDMNPFVQSSFFKMDSKRAAKIRRPLDDLVGATIVDVHQDLKQAWMYLIKHDFPGPLYAEFSAPFVSEVELFAHSERWKDEVYRNQIINQWVNQAKNRYRQLLSGS